MAGLTGFSAGLINNRLVYVPITAITANSPRRLNPRGRTYERACERWPPPPLPAPCRTPAAPGPLRAGLLVTTRQPDPLSDPAIRARWKGPGEAPKGGA